MNRKQVYLESLGCARNAVDSEFMLGRLKAAGWPQTDDPAKADAIVVNTCSFIEAATDESIDTILEFARYKEKGRCRRLVVTGCLPERYREDISQALPEVDMFLGTGAFDRISCTRKHLDLPSSQITPMTACPGLRLRWCPDRSP